MLILNIELFNKIRSKLYLFTYLGISVSYILILTITYFQHYNEFHFVITQSQTSSNESSILIFLLVLFDGGLNNLRTSYYYYYYCCCCSALLLLVTF